MRPHIWSAVVVALLVTLASVVGTHTLFAQSAERQALDGEWTYMEDRTEGRAPERLGPPMSTRFALRAEEDAVVLVFGHGSGHRDVRVALDGSMTEITNAENTARYRGSWNDCVFRYEVDFIRGEGQAPAGLIVREFRVTDDGLVVNAAFGKTRSTALYRHAEDIPLATPVEAEIGDLEWMAGAWVGTRGIARSIEERWSPPLGGAMLGISRTVSRGRMSAFEYLRIVERDDGLVYVAQPGGGTATEFVMTELTDTRAVFDNPRHSYPKRITYERDGARLTATIGFLVGGTPRRFEFEREGEGEAE